MIFCKNGVNTWIIYIKSFFNFLTTFPSLTYSFIFIFHCLYAFFHRYNFCQKKCSFISLSDGLSFMNQKISLFICFSKTLSLLEWVKTLLKLIQSFTSCLGPLGPIFIKNPKNDPNSPTWGYLDHFWGF